MCALILLIVLGSLSAGEKQLKPGPPSLEIRLESYSGAAAEALKGLARAINSYQSGSFNDVLESLPGEDAARQTALGDYFPYYRGKAALALDRASEAVAQFRALQRDFPSSPLLSESIYGEAQALLKLHNTRAARDILANPALPLNASTLFHQALAEEEGGETGKAVELYLRLYTDFVGAPQSALAQERLQALSPKSITGSSGYRSLLERSENLLAAGMNKEAQALLAKLSRVTAPDRNFAERRLVLLATAETNLGKASTVLPYLSRVGRSDPGLHARALHLIAICHRRMKHETAFLQTRDEAVRLYPDSPFTERILYSVATYYDVADRASEARDTYQRLADSFPRGPNAERALWKTALYAYIAGNYESALGGFWKYLQTYPNPRSAGAPLYWMGRCCEKMGDSTGAAALYRHAAALSNIGFYGRLAVEAESALSKTETGRPSTTLDLKLVAQSVDSIRPLQAATPQPSGSALQILERANQLAFAGLADLAQSELRWGIRQYPQEKSLSYFSSRLYAAQDEYGMVFTTLRRAIPDYDSRAIEDLPAEVWRMLFPFQHWTLVSAQAQKNNIDPVLVLGLIRQESAFDEDARSRANARGLMQLLPSTGRTLARRSGVRYTSSRLYLADTNIMLGIQHLASLLKQYGGREDLALAAYNAGSSRVEQWMNRYGNLDSAEFVERIPFTETRGYVKQVLTNRGYYNVLRPYFADLPELDKPGAPVQPRKKPVPAPAPRKPG